MDITGIVAIVMVFSIPIVAILVGYGISRHKTQVRLKAIEKGVPIPFQDESKDPYEANGQVEEGRDYRDDARGGHHRFLYGYRLCRG